MVMAIVNYPIYKKILESRRKKYADEIIDLGPDGGDGGGKIVAQGTPEEIIQVKESYTGKYLKSYLEQKQVNAYVP